MAELKQCVILVPIILQIMSSPVFICQRVMLSSDVQNLGKESPAAEASPFIAVSVLLD